MMWNCRMVETPDWMSFSRKPLYYGDMWYAPYMVGDSLLSSHYNNVTVHERHPICVYLPPGIVFCVDEKVIGGDGTGWKVEGDPPNLTLTPSVNIEGWWHGYITNGVISDDVEGRTFLER